MGSIMKYPGPWAFDVIRYIPHQVMSGNIIQDPDLHPKLPLARLGKGCFGLLRITIVRSGFWRGAAGAAGAAGGLSQTLQNQNEGSSTQETAQFLVSKR